MSNARVNRYVKNNPDRCAVWKDEVLRRHIIRELVRAHGNDDTPDANFHSYTIVGHQGQVKIFNDVMADHYDLSYESLYRDPKYGKYGPTQKTIKVRESTFKEMIEGIEVKPNFGVIDIKKTREDDIYTLITKLSLVNLVYIYKHDDEFVFMNKESRSEYGGYPVGLGVFWKEQKEEADNLAFRNALTSYFGDKLNSVSKILFDKELPDLVSKSADYESSFPAQSYDFCSAYNKVLPHNMEEVNTVYLRILERNAAFAAETFKRTAEQLRSLRESILEAGGDEKFQEYFFSKMIPYFMGSLPLFINTEDSKLKEIVHRAMKKKYY